MEKMKTSLVERAAMKIVRHVLPADERIYVDGYFEEMRERMVRQKGQAYARRWIIWQAVKSIPGFLSHQLYWKLTMLKAYLGITLRNIFAHKGFFLIKVFGLAAGIGCSMVIILYVTSELTYDAYHPGSERIFRIASRRITQIGDTRSASTPGPLGPAIRRQLPQVEAAARLIPPPENAAHVLVVQGENRFFEKRIWFADPEVFAVFRIPFLQGDPRTALSRPQSVVISEGIARKYFGTMQAMGQVLKMEIDYDLGAAISEDFQVTGIVRDAPANTHLKYDMLVSMATMTAHLPRLNQDWLEYHTKYTYVKLAPGASSAGFEKQLAPYSEQSKAIYEKQFNRRMQLHEFFTQPLRLIHMGSNLLDEIEPPGSMYYIYIYSLAALLILLIGCMNYINLSASLSATRTREVGIRKVVGGRRLDLVFQFLSESLILTFFAFMLALAFSSVLLHYFNQMAGTELTLSGLGRPQVLAALVLLFLVVGIAAGGYPALVLSSFRPVMMLRNRLAPGKSGSAVQRILVLVQFTFSIFLVVCSLVVFHQLNFMKGKSLGFDRAQKLILEIKSNQAYFRRNFEAIKADCLKHPGIRGATASSVVPGEESNSGYYLWRGGAANAGKPARLKVITVDADFVREYGIKMISGRPFQYRKAGDAENAYLVNQAGARELGFTSPGKILGERFTAHYHRKTKSIIGVTADFHFRGMKEESGPLLLDMENSLIRVLTLTVAPDNIAATMNFVKQKWGEHFPGVPFEFSFLDETFERVYRYEEQMGSLLGIITGLGVAIAFFGLFGLVSFHTQLRRREIGIRRVLGASSAEIVMMMAGRFISLVFLAGLLAIPAAYLAMNKWLQDFAYRIKPGIPVFAFAFLASMGIALAALLFQGYRAARSKPVQVLRCE